MAYFRKLSAQLALLHSLLKKDEKWLILINADPDALGAALALARLLRHRVHSVTIARINEVTRPDNLAMIRYLRIPVVVWDESHLAQYHRFALVDSQPSHSPRFAQIPFSVIIDHHPLTEPCTAALCDIRPCYGSTSTIFSEYLYNARVRPGIRLAVALQYGIRTDTASFGRNCTEVDLRAYHYLSRFAEPQLLTRIMRSEYLPEWLPCFSRAFDTLRRCGSGHFTSLEKVESPDLRVVVADFFLRVHGLRWVAVCGQYHETVVCIFRGDGDLDLGRLAMTAFAHCGSAGGHRFMARAEFPATALGGESMDSFVYQSLKKASAGQHKQELANKDKKLSSD